LNQFDKIGKPLRPFTSIIAGVEYALTTMTASALSLEGMTSGQIRQWARKVYRDRYCDADGTQDRPLKIDELLGLLQKERPNELDAIHMLRDECVILQFT
jgi:hypothetical protein